MTKSIRNLVIALLHSGIHFDQTHWQSLTGRARPGIREAAMYLPTDKRCGRTSPGRQGVASGSGAATWAAPDTEACADVSERTRGHQGRRTPTDPSAAPSTPASPTTGRPDDPQRPRRPRPASPGIPVRLAAGCSRPGPPSAHLHSEVRQPRLEFGLQSQNEGAGSRCGAAARVRQDHLSRHLGQVAAQVHRALHVLVDQRRRLRGGATRRRGQGPEPQEQQQADRRLHDRELSAADARPAPRHGATADWPTAPQDGWVRSERTPSPGQPGHCGAPD